MPIHTRAEIFGNEAVQILREISMYPGISEQQLFRFHPGKKEHIKAMLTQLSKQGRIRQEADNSYYPSGVSNRAKDHSLIQAVWVLLDYLDRAEYYTASDFPVKIVFFVEGEAYEIICAMQGQEAMICQAVLRLKVGGGRRIVLIDTPEQIPALDFPNIVGYCTVSTEGEVRYYKRRKG